MFIAVSDYFCVTPMLFIYDEHNKPKETDTNITPKANRETENKQTKKHKEVIYEDNMLEYK